MLIKQILYKLLDYQNLTKISFCLLVYAAFFGAKLPFNYEAGAKDGTASNPLNQFFYFAMFFLALLVITTKFNDVFTFILKEKYLSIFILFCILSFLWADFPLISLRRSFQLFTTYLVIVLTLLFVEKKFIISSLSIILSLYIFLTIFAIAFIPEAIDPSFNSPRGLTLQKNHLGQIMNLILLMFLMLRIVDRKRIIYLSGIIISVLLIISSKSTTALISMIYIFALQSVFLTDKIFEKLKIGRTVSTAIILLVTFFAIYISFNQEFIGKVLQEFFGKDLSFTGRTDHWKSMLLEINKHPILGVGYSSFWDVPGGDYRILLIGNSAHNGYLEILNELGIVGFLLMIFTIVSFLYRSIKIKNSINIITIIAILILNFTESSLFREKGAITFVTLWIILLTSYEYFYRLRSNN